MPAPSLDKPQPEDAARYEAFLKEPAVGEDITTVASRLAPILENFAGLTLQSTKQGVELYRKKDHLSDRLFRVGRVVVPGVTPEAVAARYWQWEDRKVFDSSSVTDSTVLAVHPGQHRKLVHLVSRPKPFCSARDFILASERRHSVVDGSWAFVQASEPAAAQPTSSCTRADIWSMFMARTIGNPAEPKSESNLSSGTTELVYAIECIPRGWVSVSVAELLADDVLMVLSSLKAELMSNAHLEEKSGGEKVAERSPGVAL
eukprot:RCo054243